MRRAVILLAAVALLLGSCTSGGTDTGRRAAPPISGAVLGGGTYDLAQHRGEVVVVNFWASLCAPCRAEIADLESTYQATRADGVSFVGVNTRDQVDQAKAFVDGRTTYPSVLDGAGQLAIGYAGLGATAIPSTVIVDRQGRVAHVFRVPVRQDTLEPLVRQVAGEPRP